jgi:hypothetical protein
MKIFKVAGEPGVSEKWRAIMRRVRAGVVSF